HLPEEVVHRGRAGRRRHTVGLDRRVVEARGECDVVGQGVEPAPGIRVVGGVATCLRQVGGVGGGAVADHAREALVLVHDDDHMVVARRGLRSDAAGTTGGHRRRGGGDRRRGGHGRGRGLSRGRGLGRGGGIRRRGGG